MSPHQHDIPHPLANILCNIATSQPLIFVPSAATWHTAIPISAQLSSMAILSLITHSPMMMILKDIDEQNLLDQVESKV